MSQDIKPGDLVMIVKALPCCGYRISRMFQPFIAGSYGTSDGVGCKSCGAAIMYRDAGPAVGAFGGYVLVSLLKKIDPPADGDSLPTRKELEQPA